MTKAMPEYRLQEHVITAAKQLGFLAYHTWNSMRSEPGYPDLMLVKDGRCLAIELKRDGQEPTLAQRRWLDAFAEVPCIETYVWHGADWESGGIVTILTGDTA